MKPLSSLARRLALGALLAAALAGCRNLNHTENGALVGSGAGALAGAIIGHQSGNKELGALIGAATGGAAGGLIGNARDANEQRDAALAHAYHQERSREAQRRALTNRDVVDLAQHGFSDEYITRTIQTRGGRFDLSTSSMIILKQSGVSENVLGAMQQYSVRP